MSPTEIDIKGHSKTSANSRKIHEKNMSAIDVLQKSDAKHFRIQKSHGVSSLPFTRPLFKKKRYPLEMTLREYLVLRL